jgi:DNA polymerase elongation subunit (family B)
MFKKKTETKGPGAPANSDKNNARWTITMPIDPRPVLAFDIETTGLDAETCDVTCACAYDPDRGIERSFVFSQGGSPEEFVSLLDEAPRLCAFNGVRFDVPFLAKRWNISDEKVGQWMLKMIDPFEACKLALGQTFSLNKLLSENGLEGKTGSGLDAVNMAKDGRWDELAEYCMHDTKVTHAAVVLPVIQIPQVVPRRFFKTRR